MGRHVTRYLCQRDFAFAPALLRPGPKTKNKIEKFNNFCEELKNGKFGPLALKQLKYHG